MTDLIRLSNAYLNLAHVTHVIRFGDRTADVYLASVHGASGDPNTFSEQVRLRFTGQDAIDVLAALDARLTDDAARQEAGR